MVFYQQLIISNAPVVFYRISITYYRPVASDIEEILYLTFCSSQKKMKKVLKFQRLLADKYEKSLISILTLEW